MTSEEALNTFYVWLELSQAITLVSSHYFEVNKDALSVELNTACVLLQKSLENGGWGITGTALEPMLTKKRKA